VLVVLAGFAISTVGCADLPADSAGPTSAALTVPVPTVNQFVVMANHGASFDDRSVISGGDIGVQASSTSALDVLSAGHDARIGVAEVLLAQKVVLGDRTIAGEIGATVVDARHAKTGPRSGFVAPPAAPAPGSFTAGTTPVSVPRRQTRALAPGKYGAVAVDGTLSLSGGLYEIASLRLGNDAHVVALAASTVRIAGGLVTGDRATMAPAAPLRAGDLRIVVAGTSDGKTSVSWGHDGRFTALIIASGSFHGEDRLIASGAVAAKDVIFEDDTKLTFDVGFECASAASCDDGNACTVDACVDARCTHTPVPMCPATQADLAVTKTVSNATPNVGDTIAFVVTLANAGPSDATGVQVTDLLPGGLTFVSATPSQGTYDATTGLWTVGAVTTGTSETLQVQARVVSPSAQTNSAMVTHADQPDMNAANNAASATETPQRADLAVTKTTDNATPIVGATVDFTVSVANNGPDAATNVAVTDLLPAGLTFVSATPSQGTYDSTTGLWTVGTVAPQASATLQVAAQVASASTEANTAAVAHADQFDPNTANNAATASETPTQLADLSVTKTVDDATPNVGGTISYLVTLANAGPSPATSVQVTDQLPAGLAFVSATPSQGSYDSTTGVWTVGTVAPGVSQTLQIQAQVVSPVAQTNTATITAVDEPDPDPANNAAAATETPQRADLAVTKTTDNATPIVGATVHFTVSVSNNGPDAATNVTVTDLLPAGLTFVSATPSQGTYDSTTGLWTIGTLPSLSVQTLSIAAQVVSGGVETNTAVISHADQFDPTTANNAATVTETPQQLVDLSVVKTVDNPTPNVGDTISYVVTLANAGPSDATSVQVTDLLPAGLTFVSATPSQGTYDSTTGVWTVGTVAAGTSQTLQLRAQVVSPNAQTNAATVTHVDQPDADHANDTSSATETPQVADLAVTKTVGNANANVGDTITYVVTLSDNGPSAATNVQVSDLLPAGLAFQAATPSQGTYDSTTGLWNVGTVAAGASQTLQIVALVSSPNAETNSATISHSDQFDPNTANNTANATETPQRADLALAKSVNNPNAAVGDQVTYLVTLSNNGPDGATNVTVTDLLPAGLMFVSATPSLGTYDSTTGVWLVGAVAAGGAQTLQVVAQVVSASGATNTAAITHSDQFDPNTANNVASATETPQQFADLALAKTVGNPFPNVGDAITYTVTLTNNGPGVATGVVVTDLLPAGLTFLSASPSQGTYDSGTGAWMVGTVASSSSATLLLVARVVSPAAQTNTASVTHADQVDPDTSNNQAGVTETPQQADLAISKTIDKPTPAVGDTVTYTIKVTDNGPRQATTVQVTDLLPGGLTFVSATASQGTYNSTTGLWSVGSVPAGTTKTLQLVATVASPAPQTNTATITHADQFDPNTANNSASATETPQ
jgi:uncharacterized repeat protein (TIGR01451 family)